jgi:hypothetical protein
MLEWRRADEEEERWNESRTVPVEDVEGVDRHWGRWEGRFFSRGAGWRLEVDSDWELPAVEWELDASSSRGCCKCGMDAGWRFRELRQATAQPQCGGIPVWRCLLIGDLDR